MKKKTWSLNNWSEYQVRTDKDLPWIKLWGKLFDKPWFQELSDQNKIIPIIFLDVARKFNNKMPVKVAWYTRNYCLKHTETNFFKVCKYLHDNGFLSDKPSDLEEKIREEKRREDKTFLEVSSDKPNLKTLWNQVCISLPKVRELSESRLTKCRARLKERSLEQWREVFERVENSNFLKGENGRGWKADFDWIIANDHNATKVIEGKYDNGARKESSDETYARFVQNLESGK